MVLLAVALGASAPALAQTIFADGFEAGTLCAWSNAPSDFEVPGNGLDDDCDGLVDEAPDVCDGGLPSDSTDALQFAAALDLCRTTTPTGPGWGVISGSLTLADGSATPAAAAHALRPSFGSGNPPRAGEAMVVLSSGAAAAPGQVNPSYVAFEPGLNQGTQSGVPADWLAAHGGVVPTAPGCPAPPGATANDSVLLELLVRVPDNAQSFSLRGSFLSSEFAEFVCGTYNDMFVALLDSTFAGSPANPTDKNLAFYEAPGGGIYPVSADLAFGNSGLFTQCVNGNTGCQGGVPGVIVTCTSVQQLAGTGMDVATPGACDPDSLRGGGTGWFVIRGNVVPGETITLRLGLWDAGDHTWDSLMLLDDFEWSVDIVVPGATLE